MQVRRFFSPQLTCPRKTFAEAIPDEPSEANQETGLW
jgi:hypothetical protein